MDNLQVLDMSGNKLETMDIPKVIAKLEVNSGFLHKVIIGILANARLGLACVKGRGEVKGTGKKVYKQKGTGNARHGDKRANVYRGGGVAFGPGNTNYAVKINQKEKIKALQMALKQRIIEENLKIFEGSLEKINTKEFLKTLQNLKLDKEKVVLILKRNEEIINKSARNLENVYILHSDTLNVQDVLKYKNLLFKKDAFLEVIKKWEKN